ncbi:MAG: hypothetical protein KDB26_03710 [Microthrixaceae bacterium]|nr:hypothetical protein [Microthrixaceae bacterium]
MTSTVSGEPNCPVVTFGANAQLAQLVSVVSQIDAVGIGQHALIGGLAVAVRLSTAHRVTVDIDTVTDDSVPTAAALLNNRRGAKAASDLFDLLWLIENRSLRQDALSSLSRALWGIGHLTATALEVTVIADPTVAYRSMLREGLDVHSLDPEQIHVLTGVFVEQLQQD